MSLQLAAQHLASQGRGNDSMLIHMTPGEIKNLQELAMAHGGSLTINPHTGLPEAGFLSNILKAIVPMALGAWLGPAGAAFGGGLFETAAGAGLAVGAGTAALTGDLNKGLKAGLGAYGGAGLGESMALAGNSAISEAVQKEALEKGLTGDAYNSYLQKNLPERLASAAPMDKLSAGISNTFANPENAWNYTKANAKSIGAAALPIFADLGVKSAMPQTTTKPATVHPYSYDPYSGRYTAYPEYEVTKSAASGGVMGFDESSNAPITRQNMESMGRTDGMFNYAHDGGGVMRMAEGGISRYADGGPLDVNNPIYQYFAKPETQALLSSGNDKAIADAIASNKWSLSDVANATGTQNQLGDYANRFVKAEATPTTDASEFMAATKAVGLQNQGLANALQSSGLSAADQYALTHSLSDAGINLGALKETDFYKNLGYTTGTAPGDQGGMEGLYANINYSAQKLQDQINAGKLTVQQAQNLALAEMDRVGVNQRDIKAATGKDFGNLFTPKPVTPPPTTTITPGETKLSTATTYDNGAFGNYGSGPATGVDYLGRTVSIATPGDIITNPDQSRTIVPNIPGRPYGGFTGMDQVKSAYTAGGGSLGYIPYAPKTIAEFNAKYKNTGGSKQAYDYLSGKAPYSPVPYTPTGELMKPYAESVLGIPEDITTKRFLFDPVTKTYKENPAYIPPKYTSAGRVSAAGTTSAAPSLTTAKIIYVTNNRGESEAATLGDDGNYHTSSGDAYDVTGNPVVAKAKGGMAHRPFFSKSTGKFDYHAPQVYADGGMSDNYDLGSYSDGGRLLKGPGDGVSDSIPATIGGHQPARLADGEFVVPARIVSELGNGSTEAGARKLYAMMDRVQNARRGSIGKGNVAKNTRADKHLPA